MDNAPLRFTIYDRTYKRLGWVNNPRMADVTINHNLPSVCTFALDEDHRWAQALATPGARVVVEYTGLDDPEPLMSGVVSTKGERDGQVGTVTFSVKDDKSLWWELLGWVKPNGTRAQQGDDDSYYRISGTAEYVAKTLVTANMGHVNLPLTVAPNGARGSNVKATLRMHPLADRILPAVDHAGIGLDAYQDGAGIRVDVYQPTDRSGRPALTEASGIVQSGTWSATPPTVTRVVVAGPGEGRARKFVTVIDAAAEAQWGVSIEQVRDARDVEDTDPNMEDTLIARGQEMLDEGAAQYALTATLSETPAFRYGVAYGLGDILPVQLTGAPVITERVRTINFSLTPDDGFVITPHIGVDDSIEHVNAKYLARLAAGVRDLKVSY